MKPDILWLLQVSHCITLGRRKIVCSWINPKLKSIATEDFSNSCSARVSRRGLQKGWNWEALDKVALHTKDLTVLITVFLYKSTLWQEHWTHSSTATPRHLTNELWGHLWTGEGVRHCLAAWQATLGLEDVKGVPPWTYNTASAVSTSSYGSSPTLSSATFRKEDWGTLPKEACRDCVFSRRSVSKQKFLGAQGWVLPSSVQPGSSAMFHNSILRRREGLSAVKNHYRRITGKIL